ncbi:hypothetical protein ACFS4T_27405 [Pseudomonas lini]
MKLLSVDFNAVHQAVSSVDIIVAVLEKNSSPSMDRSKILKRP